MISIARKDGHSQRDSLANNLPADAADMLEAVHGRRMGKRGRNVKGLIQGSNQCLQGIVSRRIRG
jgi:hypothetical protein